MVHKLNQAQLFTITQGNNFCDVLQDINYTAPRLKFEALLLIIALNNSISMFKVSRIRQLPVCDNIQEGCLPHPIAANNPYFLAP